MARLLQIIAPLSCLTLVCAPMAASDSPSKMNPPPWSVLAHQIGQDLARQGSGLPTGWYFPASPGVPHRGSIVCLHGIQTHADWFAPLARELNAKGYALYCPDRRYSGHHPKNNGVARGSPKTWVQEVQSVITVARRRGTPVYLLGTSWGAKVALGVLAEDPHQVAGTIMLVPAIKTTKETPKEMLKVLLCLPLNLPVSLPLKERHYLPGPVSESAPLPPDDDAFVKDMKSDELVLHKATPWFQLKALFLQKRSLKKVEQNQAAQRPVLVLLAEEDQIVHNPESLVRLEKAFGKVTMGNLSNLRQTSPSRTGHGVQIQNPRAVSREIDAWARSLPR